MAFGLIIDALIAVLLLVTIVYAVRLDRKLAGLRTAKDELATVLAGFAAQTAKAERGLTEMRAAAETIGQSLQQDIDQGRSMVEDLDFLVERSGSLADRLEANLRVGRERDGAAESEARQDFRKDRAGNLKRGMGAGSRRLADHQAPAARNDEDAARPRKQAALLKALQSLR